MINTFKPYLYFFKRMNIEQHDWFSIGSYFNNYLQFHISIYGYGFRIGIKLFDVLKEPKGEKS